MMNVTSTLVLPEPDAALESLEPLESPKALHPRAAPLELPAPKSPAARRRVFWGGILAVVAWIALGVITLVWPNKPAGFAEWNYTTEFGLATLVVAAFWAVFSVTASFCLLPRVSANFRKATPWLIVLAIIFALWEILTAKTGVLPPPFFAPPSSLIDVYVNDWPRLSDSAFNTLKLLGKGVLFGGVAGFLIGVSIGWSKAIGYWVHPVLRMVGPLPPTALLPITFFVFPSSHAASVFLIALATSFPLAILTWSGIAGVNKSYYDVARTMGASEWFLILRVAIPAALPQVFVGLFMGLGASFMVLVVAEMMGVKSGLGWYLTWAQGYASYENMYAALIVMALIFSSVISLLFLVRDRVLVWQKGIVKW
jgi:NitT/TauT family transport system permease protein